MRLEKQLATSVLALFGLAIGSHTANATPVVWEFSGTITELSCIRGCPPAEFDVGTPFSGSVTFDTSWPGYDSLQGVTYRGNGQPYGFDVVVGTTHYDHVGRTTYYNVANDALLPYPPPGHIYDSLQLDDHVTLHPSPVDAISTTFSDETATLLSSNQLVVLPPALTDLTSATFSVGGFISVIPAWEVRGPIDQLTIGPPIPEPRTALLLALGLIALAQFSHKGRRSYR